MTAETGVRAASRPSQFWSVPSPGTSTAPGRIAAFASSQSVGTVTPSLSASAGPEAGSTWTPMFQARVAGLGSTLPAASRAATVNVWVPGISEALNGLVHALSTPSTAHTNDEVSLALNRNVVKRFD